MFLRQFMELTRQQPISMAIEHQTNRLLSFNKTQKTMPVFDNEKSSVFLNRNASQNLKVECYAKVPRQRLSDVSDQPRGQSHFKDFKRNNSKRRRAVSLLLASIFLLLNSRLCGGTQAGSGCSDPESTSDDCFEGSGSGDGINDVTLDENPDLGEVTICRSSRLATWFPGSSENIHPAYKMIQSCRSLSASTDTLSKCQTVDQRVPVEEMTSVLPVTSLISNLTYFNRFCFLCSGDPGPEVTWSVNVSCSRWVALQFLESEEDVIRAAVKSHHCWIHLQAPMDIVTDRCDILIPLSFPPTRSEGRLAVSQVAAPLSVLINFWSSTETSAETEKHNSTKCSEKAFHLWPMASTSL